MNLSNNDNLQSQLSNQFTENELKQNLPTEEKKDEFLPNEKEAKKKDFNNIESSKIQDQNINKNNIDEIKEQKMLNNSNFNLTNEITIENNKTKNPNHEIVPECINNCINWTLRAHINKKNNQNFKYSFTFQGKNIFFPKLEYSILNAMNNSSCFEKCFPKNNNFENKKKIIEKLKQESLFQLNNIDIINNENKEKNLSENASLKNILEFKFPIDNSKNNFNIIDNNLCLNENLNNVFLLKFDLKNAINSNNFRLINDNCVDREVEFRLNGDFHGNKIFTNDLLFSVTYRDFIKAIQFRLDNFKSKILANIYNRKYGENQNYYLHQNQDKNQKKFYGKMINNVNIGIEFFKPQPFNQLQTNFNSIVNSEIELIKIFIELTIPKKLIQPKNINSNNIIKNNNNEKNNLTKSEDIKTENINIKEPKYYIPPPPPIYVQKLFIPPPPYIPPPPPIPASWANLNLYNMRISNKSEIPIPPPFAFNNLIYKNDFQLNKKNSLKNQLAYNNKFPNVTFDYISINDNYHKSPSLSLEQINAYSSPNSVNCNYSPMSASFLMMQPMHYFGGVMSSPFNISNYSSPYIKKSMNFQNINQRKFSDSYNHDLFDSLLENKNNIYLNTSNINKIKEDDFSSSLNLQQSITSKSLNDTDITSSGYQNNHLRKLNPMTIKQRIIDSYKKQDKENDKNNIMNNINKIDSRQMAKNLRRELRDTFVVTNQGKTNFEIFIESVTPKFTKNNNFPFLKLKLIDIFNKFKKLSLFGLKNIYSFNGELIYSIYLLSLSTLSIKIINKSLMNDIISSLKNKYDILKKYDNIKPGEEITINISQYIIYFSLEYIQICFSENKPFQHRNPFIKIIFDLNKSIPYFDKITIEDINLIDSLFSILYSPLKCSKPYINYSSFIVYYQFTKEIIQENGINKDYLNYDKQTITGVLPLKINTNLYFQRIIIYNFVMNISPLFNYFSPYFNNDTMMIKNMVYSVINDVSKHIRGVSYDYEYFLKLSKHNSFNPWN